MKKINQTTAPAVEIPAGGEQTKKRITKKERKMQAELLVEWHQMIAETSMLPLE